jgi:hypothetical protein
VTFHQFPDAGDAAFDVVHTMPAAGSPAAGEVPPAPPVAPLVASHEPGSVNGQWLTEGGTLAELEQWEPTGCVDDDLAFLASVAFLAQTCKAVLSAHSGTVAEMLKADRPEKHATVPGGTVERVWKSRSWKWDRTSDVLAVILEETEEIPPQTRAALEEGLPPRVSWRIGNAEKDEPGLSRLGIDVAELRHREPGGRWELRFTWGDPS